MSAVLAYAPFSRPLAAPFIYGNKTVSTRNGILLRKSSSACTIFSEASPLPGHSSDNLDQVHSALQSISGEALLTADHGPETPASLSFALEGLTAQEHRGRHSVASNALLRWSDLPSARLQMKQFIAAGYTHCKLKISPANWEEQVVLLEEFPELRFRLDANLGLTATDLDKLFHFLETRSLAPLVDYIEEPFSGVWENVNFRNSPVPLAADDSANSTEAVFHLLNSTNSPSVFVVKPTVLGGLMALSPTLRALKSNRKRVIFTSALETEPGRRAILAFLAQNSSEVCGLSTGFLFCENFLPDRAVWSELPTPSAAELSYLESLPWKNCQ